LKFDLGHQNNNKNEGYGIRFVEKKDPSVIVTFLFVLAIVVGLLFGVFWSVYEKDV